MNTRKAAPTVWTSGVLGSLTLVAIDNLSQGQLIHGLV